MDISKADLKDLITTAVTAAVQAVSEENNKPKPLTPEEKAKVTAQQQDRLEMSGIILDKMEKAKEIKRLCTHRRKDGTGRGVYVVEGPYVLCQGCQVKVWPLYKKPTGYEGQDIYDDALFNRMLQESSSVEMSD